MSNFMSVKLYNQKYIQLSNAKNHHTDLFSKKLLSKLNKSREIRSCYSLSNKKITLAL